MARKLSAFAPPLAWALLVWLIGGSDTLPTGGLTRVPGADKLAHFAMYGVLGWLTARGWVAAGLHRGHVGAVLVIAMMGAADELRQAGLASRSAEAADWLADTAGAAAGFLLGLHRTRMQRENDERDEQQ